MNKSDSIKNLAEALNKAQAEFSPAPENANNPHLRNKYADLGSIIETVKPVLAKYGLSVSQLVEGHAGEIGVSNVLMHASGEWLESYVSMPIADAKGINPAQAAGSIVSYLRRYSLAAMLGIYAGGDDDANGGNHPAPKATREAPAASVPATLPETKAKTNGANGSPKPAWPKAWKDKLISAKYADNDFEAAGMLGKSHFITPTSELTLELIAGWGKYYRAERDNGGTPDHAAEIADAKLKAHLQPA